MSIAARLENVLKTIDKTRKRFNVKQTVTLLAVSKRQPIAALQAAYDAGQRAFGENYVQEAQEKMAAFNPTDAEWHFIGHLQTNKAKLVATHFDWVHTIDRLKIAQKLSQAAIELNKSLNVCIQVNISDESAKSGVKIEQLEELAYAVAELDNLVLRGLMVIPAKMVNFEQARSVFADVRQLKDRLAATIPLDTLSMGMSGDYEAAIAEGATIIRLGTSVFGPRAT